MAGKKSSFTFDINTSMKFKPAPIWMNILGCACFLVLPFFMRPGNFSEIHLADFRTKVDLVVYTLIIGFFYLNYYILVPRYFFTHQYFVYFILAAACFITASFLPDLLFPMDAMPLHGNMPDHRPPPKGNFFIDKTSRHFFIFTASLLFSLLLKIYNRLRQAENDKMKSEITYLRAQINPHFLFNTLNSIYSLAVQNSPDTSTAVVKLSGMMRYVLDEAPKDFVSLEKELAYIEDYISLQQLRFGKTIPLKYSLQGDPNGKIIAPLILISFIENAFKHGINAAEEGEIKIEMAIENIWLSLYVFNLKVTMHLPGDKSGLGIANTKKRLDLVYAGRHELMVEDTVDYFSVKLKLKLS